jgi:DNA-binding transcriptional LysR family regulator
MDLEEMRALIAVVESGSFLGAARTLGVSRTTLKRQVASLEARAGVPLVEAVQTGVVATDAGRLLSSRGRAMMAESSALLASIRELGQEPSGQLRCVLPVGLPPAPLAALMVALRSEHPKLRFVLRHSDDPLSEPLREVDIAVHFGEDPPPGNWMSYVVLRLPERLVASRDYVAARGTPRTLEELRGHDLFAWQPRGEDPSLWTTRAGGTFRVEPKLVSADVHLVRHCCLAGLGIGLVPDAGLPDPGFPDGTAVTILPDLVGRERAIRLSVPAVLADIPKVRMVIDRARRFVGEL